jgi:glucosamine-6-phosphate deaminase
MSFRVFDTPEALAAYAADLVLQRFLAAMTARGVAVLGCPSGRTPLPTYRALAERFAAHPIDGRNLHLVMMDEYLVPDGGGGWRLAPEDAHFSCIGFAERHIRGAFNEALPHAIPRSNLHAPDPSTPERYEEAIATLGGIDAFLLASGESDGHVAFNPPGTPLAARTRIVELAEATREDNMQTFPGFRSLADVPTHGISVGPATIAAHSHSAMMILTGAAKGEALRRIQQSTDYDPTWPSTIVHHCRNAEILADAAAAGAMS